MSTYMTHFVIQFRVLTDEERKFWRTAREDFDELIAPPDPGAVLDRYRRVYGQKLLDELDTSGSAGFEIWMPEDDNTLIHITDADGNGNPFMIGEVCRAYLRTFDCDDPVAFTYAATCDREAVDGFHGGWVHVTQKRTMVYDAFSAMNARLGEHGSLNVQKVP